MMLGDEDVKVLCAAVVGRAAIDYREARKYFRDLKRGKADEEEKFYYERLLSDCERFFRSQWFYQMGGSPAMFKQLKRECDIGYFRKERE